MKHGTKSKPSKEIYRCTCGRELQVASKIETDTELVITVHPCSKCMDQAVSKRHAP